MITCWCELQIVCIWSSLCNCIPKLHLLLPHLNPDWFLPFWYRLTQVVLEKRPLNGGSVVVVFGVVAAGKPVAGSGISVLKRDELNSAAFNNVPTATTSTSDRHMNAVDISDIENSLTDVSRSDSLLC